MDRLSPDQLRPSRPAWADVSSERHELRLQFVPERGTEPVLRDEEGGRNRNVDTFSLRVIASNAAGEEEMAYEFCLQLVGDVVAMSSRFSALERDPGAPTVPAQAEDFTRAMLEEWFSVFIAWSVLDYRGRFPN